LTDAGEPKSSRQLPCSGGCQATRPKRSDETIPIGFRADRPNELKGGGRSREEDGGNDITMIRYQEANDTHVEAERGEHC